MIQFILSIILSLAMMVSGVGSPAELPDVAPSWSLGHVKLDILGQSYELGPWLTFAGKVSEDEASLHFVATSSSAMLLPVSLGVDRDALKLSFGTGERVYTIGEDVLMEMAEIEMDDLEDLRMLEKAGEFYLNYGSLAGTLNGAMKNDPELMKSVGQTTIDALLESCASELQDVEVEVGGQTLTARQTVIDITPVGAIHVVDALSDCGVPEAEAFFDSLLDIANEAGGTNYASWGEVLERDLTDIANESLGMPFIYTAAETDELSYAKVDFDITANDVKMRFSEEAVRQGEEANTNIAMYFESLSDGAIIDVSADVTALGPMYAPTLKQLEMDFSGSTNDDYDAVNIAAHVSGQSEKDADGLSSGRFSMNMDYEDEDMGTVPITFSAEWAERAETPSSVTNSVNLSTSVMGIDMLGVSFDINCMDFGNYDAFKNMEEVPVTLGMLEGEGEDPESQYFMAAILSDASRAYMDAMRLYNDPGIQALVEDFSALLGSADFTGLSASAEDASIGIIGGADGPTSVYVATSR